MKPFQRIKKINGKEYLYEITPYYDPVKKTIRQKSKYLGKNINGIPLKVHSQGVPPKSVLGYGEFIPFKKIIADLKLDDILTNITNIDRARTLLVLAMDRSISAHPLRYVANWYEGTCLSGDYPDLSLSPQYLSDILRSIGEGNVPLEFSHYLIKNLSTFDTLIYDITSVSSYSQNISLFEYGYNRDGNDLSQVNLSLIVDEKLGIPVMYDIYPGSIVDVSTLKNTIHKIKAQGINSYTLIMDRGFFSTDNIVELVSSDVSFIIPPASTLKNVKEAISSIHSKIEDPDYLKMYQKEPLFVMPVVLDIGDIRLNGYAYYDQKREQQERNSFYKRLFDLVAKLKSINLKPWMDPVSIFRETAKRDAKYIEWSLNEGRFDVSLKKNAISQRVNKMGKFILLYRGNFEWDKCLSLYRSKDLVEKSFDFLKNDIEIMPMNMMSESTLRGYLFVCFLALILKMRLLHMIRDSGLLAKYSCKGLITELEKIRLLVLPNGEKVITEVTKQQRNILDAMELCA
jgi:transposase